MKCVALIGAALLAAPALFSQNPTPVAASPSQNPASANQAASALLSNNDALAQLRRIAQLMEERKAAYARAEITVDTSDLPVSAVAERVLRALEGAEVN